MTDRKVSDLTASSALVGTELFYADNGLNDVKVTADQIKAFTAQQTDTAAEIAFTPSGNLSSTNVQDAIEELDSEKLATSILITRGDIITRGASAAQRLALGTSGYALKSDGTDTVWKPSREVTIATRTIYVATTGSDTTGDGSVGNPFATLQKAWDYARANIDLGSGLFLVIQLSAGTYSSATYNLVASGKIPGQDGSISVQIKGDINAPEDYVLDADLTCIRAEYGAQLTVYGVKLTATSDGILATGAGSWVSYNSCEFGACGLAHLEAQKSGVTFDLGDNIISGNAVYHNYAIDGGTGYETTGETTLVGTPAFTTYAHAHIFGHITGHTKTYTGTCTGKRFSATVNSSIGGDTDENFFPGNSAGTTDSTSTFDNLSITSALTDGLPAVLANSPNSGEFARFTAAGLEGLTESEFKAAANLEIGTDVGAVVDIQEFTSSGTWTKPTGAKFVFAQVFGGGGGGGGGARTASGTQSSGGGGGGAGSYNEAWYAAADLAGTETVTVGAGGTLGAGATSDGNAGSNGGQGGSSSFSSSASKKITGYGGGAGAGGQIAGASGGGGGAGHGAGGNASAGTGGAAGSVTGAAGGSGAGGSNGAYYGAGSGGSGCANASAGSLAGFSAWGPSGGAAGGGVDSTPTGKNGGISQGSGKNEGAAGGGTAPGGAGSAGDTAASKFGQGGSGGAGHGAGAGGAGGAAGTGAGGGGGGSAVGGNGGDGAAGGAGYVRVITFF